MGVLRHAEPERLESVDSLHDRLKGEFVPGAAGRVVVGYLARPEVYCMATRPPPHGFE